MTGRLVVCAVALVLLGGCGSSHHGVLPAPSFVPSENWVSLTTGSSNAPGWDEASVWALTARSNLAALAPFDFSNNLLHLSRDAIYISAGTVGRGGPTKDFKPSAWPLRLSRFQLERGWEGQPASNVQLRLDPVDVKGWRLDVRVFFATQHPSKRLLRTAQRELDRLVLP